MRQVRKPFEPLMNRLSLAGSQRRGCKERCRSRPPFPFNSHLFTSRPLGRRWLAMPLVMGFFTQNYSQHHSAKREVYVWHQSVCSNFSSRSLTCRVVDNFLLGC